MSEPTDHEIEDLSDGSRFPWLWRCLVCGFSSRVVSKTFALAGRRRHMAGKTHRRVVSISASGSVASLLPRALRCLVTKNRCGSDTWMVGRPCQCDTCFAWLRLSEVEAALAEIAFGKIAADMDNGWICAARLSGIARAALSLLSASKEKP
jgi:hypothetical protein